MERGNQGSDPYESYEAHEAFDAVLAAGAPLAGLTDTLSEGDPLAWRQSADTPPLGSGDARPTRYFPPGATLETLHRRRLIPEEHEDRKRARPMERWEDGATGATAMDAAGALTDAESASVATTPTSGATPEVASEQPSGVNTPEGSTPAAPRVEEWAMEFDESPDPSRVMRIALIAGVVSLSALAIAGGVTALVIVGRRRREAREMERAIASSRLLRFSPAVARSHLLEASRARANASQYARQSAAETAHMARALRAAAGVSASTAREYAAERAAETQEAISNAYSAAKDTATGAYGTAKDTATGAYDAAKDSATGVLRAVKQTAPSQRQWYIRAFNAGRFTGRLEQRMR